MPEFRLSCKNTLPADALSSVVVFLVALPLCMGVAIASGLPPAAGLITGIVGGILVGLLSGSSMLVSGPAAGLTVLVWEIVHDHGVGMLGWIVLGAGCLQVLAGVLKLGQWFRAISPAVVHGMLAGIGVLLVLGQIHVVVDDAPKGTAVANLLALPGAFARGLLPQDGTAHHLAALLGVITIAIMLGWKAVPKPLKTVPAPLAAVAAATGLAWALGWPVQRVEVPANLLDAVQWPTLAGLAEHWSPAALGAVLSIAIIASAETLLSATAVDQMHAGPRTRYNRELVAQGIGNALCGLLGALPMTGVIVRSSANVQAGAKTRLSTILHGVWILVAIVALPWLLSEIPTAALAAMLVYTGAKLISPAAIKEIARYGKAELAIFVATIGAIVLTNLLEGVLLGLVLSAFKLLSSYAGMRARIETDEAAGETRLVLSGAATFIRLPQLAETLERLPAGGVVRIEDAALDYIDHACLDLLAGWAKQRRKSGGATFADWDALEAKYHHRRKGHRPEGLPEAEPFASPPAR